MRIAFIDNAGSLLSVAWTIQQEGHDVFYHIAEGDKLEKKIGDGLVAKASIAEIKEWNPDAVVAYNVPNIAGRFENSWGSSQTSVHLERDRMFAASLVKRYGVGRLPETYRFSNTKEAERLIASGRSDWVFKAEGTPGVSTTHVSRSHDELLAIMDFETRRGAKRFILQEFVEGVEISIEGWFDYRSGWLRPFNSTLERKKLMSGDLGPMTGCMGSVVWMWPQERPRLFRQTLEKLTPHLESIRYVGPIDGNFIIDYKTREPNWLEFTPRLGWNAFEALMIMGGDWGEFFVELGRGEAQSLPLRGAEIGAAVRLYTPTAEAVPVWGPIQTERRLFPKDIYQKDDQLYTVGCETTNGLTVVFEAAAEGGSIKQALAEIYEDVIPLVSVCDLTYRDDIGEQAERDLEMLEAWGYSRGGR